MLPNRSTSGVPRPDRPQLNTAGRRARITLAFGLAVVLVALFAAAPLFAEAGSINTCLSPCHGTVGIAPDVETAYDASGGGHRMNWNPKVVAETGNARYTQGSRMPCDECHAPHGGATSSIYSFNETRVGAPITEVRQLCEGCHRPYDSTESTPTVCGLKLRKLPASASAHADASTQACSDCHGSTGHAPEGHGGGGGGACSDCHGDNGSHVIHTSATDPRGPGGLACGDCHDTGNYPGFAAGSDIDLSGKIELDETTSCDGCHSPGGGYNGVDSEAGPSGVMSVGAKDVWDTGAYETSSTLRAGAEKWCVGCHDGDKGVAGEEPSLMSSVYAAPVGGYDGVESIYGTAWGYYETGHGLATDTAFPSSGGVATGAGLECDACHDYEKSHIDGDEVTYNAAGGSASYRDGFRLVQVDLGAGLIDPMILPLPQSGPNSGNAKERYALCSSCHDPQPFVGTNNDTNLMTSGTNYHAYHQGMNNIVYNSDQSGGTDSRCQCITCHNVHGSTQLAMVRDGKMLDQEPGLQVWYRNDAVVQYWPMTPQTPEPPDLTLIASTGLLWIEQPTFCGACHNHNYIKASDRAAALRWKGSVPALDWTWEAGYEGRGINTDRLFNTTEDVPFRFEYYDPNNDAPTSIELHVDLDDNGSYEASETTTLVEDDPGDTTYTNGKIYRATVTVTEPADGSIDYYASATDGTHDAVGAPTEGQTITWDANGMRDVPGEYGTIQEAIDAAYDGNTILVDDGSYGEELDTGGKGIHLKSVNGTSTTTLTGDGTGDACMTVSSGATSVTIEGFTIDNQHETQNGPARGLRIESGTQVTLRDCLIQDNNPRVGNYGGGIWLEGAGLTVENTTITDNSCYWGGAAVYAQNTTMPITFTDSVISDNTGQDYPGVYLISCEATTTFTRTSILRNGIGGSRNHGGGLTADNSPLELYDCTVEDNVGGDAQHEHGGGIRVTGTDGAAYIEGGSIKDNYCGGDGAGVYISGSTVPDALTIVNVDMTGNNANHAGGAICAYNVTGTVRLTNVDFDDCSSQYGGAAIRADCPVIVTDCSMNRCTGRHGGNVEDSGAAIHMSGTNASLTISNTPMNDCVTGRSGAGIYISGSTKPEPLNVTNVEITNGRGLGGGYVHSGGGIYITNCTYPSVITSVTIDDCLVEYSGGGIWTDSSLVLSDSTITNNFVNHYWDRGGGIFVYGGSAEVTITDTLIEGNSAPVAAGISFAGSQLHMEGGAVKSNVTRGEQDGAGITVTSGYAMIDGVYVQGNHGHRHGAGIHATVAIDIVNCTVTGNIADGRWEASGGGIYLTNGSSTVVNTTIAGNYAEYRGGGTKGNGSYTNCIIYGNTSGNSLPQIQDSPTVTYSDVQGGYTGAGNIDQPPSFVATAAASAGTTNTGGDFHLKADSLCAGGASAGVAPADDIDGDSRPQGSGVDMGSDEILGGSQSGAMKFGPVGGALAVPADPTTHTAPPAIPAPPVTASLADESGFLLVGSSDPAMQDHAGRSLSGTARNIGRDIGVGEPGAPLGMPEPALPAAALGLTSMLALAWKVLGRIF